MAKDEEFEVTRPSKLDFKTGGGKRVMDFRPSQGLAAGLKRIGGRGGTSRLGQKARPKGKLPVSHRF